MTLILGPHGIDPISRGHSIVRTHHLFDLGRIASPEQHYGVVVVPAFNGEIGLRVDFEGHHFAEFVIELFVAVIVFVGERKWWEGGMMRGKILLVL
jgi:hypothetical protein